MVSVQHKLSSSSGTDTENIQSWLDSLPGTFAPAEIEVIRHACEFAAPLYAGQAELTGAPLLQHALGAAVILAGVIITTWPTREQMGLKRVADLRAASTLAEP